MDPLVILFSLTGPFLVWPLEILLPYPYIIEELFKSIVVWFGPKGILSYIIGGILFAVTETVFYSYNLFSTGEIRLIFIRLLLTGLLHSATFAIIYISTIKNKKLILLGFFAAVIIHFLYNQQIINYL